MSYWAVARLELRREQLALRCLGLAGYETYFSRLRERRISHGRKIEVRPPLFPGYCFLTVEAQWYAARRELAARPRWNTGRCDRRWRSDASPPSRRGT